VVLTPTDNGASLPMVGYPGRVEVRGSVCLGDSSCLHKINLLAPELFFKF